MWIFWRYKGQKLTNYVHQVDKIININIVGFQNINLRIALKTLTLLATGKK